MVFQNNNGDIIRNIKILINDINDINNVINVLFKFYVILIILNYNV